jgi:hypothetical protein
MRVLSSLAIFRNISYLQGNIVGIMIKIPLSSRLLGAWKNYMAFGSRVLSLAYGLSCKVSSVSFAGLSRLHFTICS